MENGRLGCFAGETMENTVKLCKTIQNHGKPYKTMENLKRGFGCFYLLQLLKKKNIKKQLLVADGGIIENKVLFSYVWLLRVICGYVWFLLFWCAFLWGCGIVALGGVLALGGAEKGLYGGLRGGLRSCFG